MTIDEEKKQLRSIVKQKIALLSKAYCKHADQAIFERVTALKEYQQAKTIFAYVGRADEINTKPILLQAWQDKKRVCVPLCIGKGIMEAREIKGLDDLQVGAYGILEPKEGMPFIEPTAIDMALIPCMTGNIKGQRLGYGGGFYDRYLTKGTFCRVLLCRQKLMEQQIPTDDHDMLMDIVVSEENTIYV